jgi:hypothetical protein
MLAQHLYSLIMFQRLAISSAYGWNRFVKMVDRVHPRKGGSYLPYNGVFVHEVPNASSQTENAHSGQD